MCMIPPIFYNIKKYWAVNVINIEPVLLFSSSNLKTAIKKLSSLSKFRGCFLREGGTYPDGPYITNGGIIITDDTEYMLNSQCYFCRYYICPHDQLIECECWGDICGCGFDMTDNDWERYTEYCITIGTVIIQEVEVENQENIVLSS